MAGRIKQLSMFVLGHIDEITIGTSRGYSLNNSAVHQVFVVRVAIDEVYAYRNSCPHKGYEEGSMAWRKHHFLNGNGRFIQCGSHGALFEIDNGLCVHGPCINKRLEKLEVTCDHQGLLCLHLDSEKKL